MVILGFCFFFFFLGTPEAAGESRNFSPVIRNPSGGRQVLPGQPKRRPGAQRAAGLLPKGKAQTQSRLSPVLQQLHLFFPSCACRNTPAWAQQIRRTSSCAGWPFKLSTASSTWQRATGWCSVLCTTPGVDSLATAERKSSRSPKFDFAFLWFFILSGHTSMVPQSPARSSFITATESCGGTTIFLGL